MACLNLSFKHGKGSFVHFPGVCFSSAAVLVLPGWERIMFS